MSTLGPWIQAARPLAQANLAIPLLYGEALAYARHGAFSPAILVALLGYGLALQLFIVASNDLADEAGDRQNRTQSRFSGGSRVLPEGKLRREDLRGLAAAGLIAACGVALYLTLEHGRTWMLAAPAAGALLVWAYSWPPIRAAYRGHGELLQGIGVGAVLPLTAIYAQSGEISMAVLPALLPAMLLGVVGNLVTSLPDAPADAAVDKRSYAVLHGQWRTRRHAIELTLVAALLANMVLPELSLPLDLLLAAPAVALLVIGARLLGSADADNPDECERFVLFVGGAGHVLLITWSLALVVIGLTRGALLLLS